ncbi:hypothetical protein CJ419_23260 [Vibrio navarrensis]|nr:hypothetical protein [Vibrio navarrensis]
MSGLCFFFLPRLIGFEFVGQWALFSGQLFFGAGNSENCLNQVSGRREVRTVGSIRNLILGFSFWLAKFKVWFSKL